MLTFEKVLDVFKDYLADDGMYEIVMTSHGYTVMEWDGCLGDWTDSKLCKTPQDTRSYAAGSAPPFCRRTGNYMQHYSPGPG